MTIVHGNVLALLLANLYLCCLRMKIYHEISCRSEEKADHTIQENFKKSEVNKSIQALVVNVTCLSISDVRGRIWRKLTSTIRRQHSSQSFKK